MVVVVVADVIFVAISLVAVVIVVDIRVAATEVLVIASWMVVVAAVVGSPDQNGAARHLAKPARFIITRPADPGEILILKCYQKKITTYDRMINLVSILFQLYWSGY